MLDPWSATSTDVVISPVRFINTHSKTNFIVEMEKYIFWSPQCLTESTRPQYARDESDSLTALINRHHVPYIFLIINRLFSRVEDIIISGTIDLDLPHVRDLFVKK